MSSEIQPVNEHRTDLINILNTSTTEALNNINVGGFYFLQKKTANGYHFCFIKVSSKEPVYEDDQLIDFDITGSAVYIITDITGRIINSAEIGIRSIKDVMSNNTHLASDNWMMYVSDAKMYNGKLYEVCYNIIPADPSCLSFTSVLDGSVVGIEHRDTLGELPPDFQYSYDLETWNNWGYQTITGSSYTTYRFSNITLNKGDRIYVRSHADTLGQDSNNYTEFQISKYSDNMVLVAGNIQSLIGFKNTVPGYCYYNLFLSCAILTTPELPATILNESCYQRMFGGCNSLIVAPALPATTLANICYYDMFYNCTSLIAVPALPATTLARHCYYEMFCKCTSLTQAPELPATILAEYCYDYMFQDCTSLTQAPTLPATTLAEYCYGYMFQNCTSLTQAPELPATKLASYCYHDMFYNCTSLTQAPILPATKLVENCYGGMFYNCTSLTQAPELPATILAERCYSSMFFGCTSLTQAPILPAERMKTQCYSYMFSGCTSLISAPELPATAPVNLCYSFMFKDCTNLINCADLSSHQIGDRSYRGMYSGCTKLNNIITPYIDSWTESYFTDWVQGVAPTGTMYKPNNLTIPVGNNGIPSGWVTAPITKTITLSAVGEGSQFGYMITGDSTVYIINPGETKQVSINENQTITLDSMSQLCVIIDGIMTEVISEPITINFTDVRKNISCQSPSTMSNLFCISSVDNTIISVKMDHYGTNQYSDQTQPVLYASSDGGSWNLWDGQEIMGNKIYFWGPNQSISSSSSNYSTFSKGGSLKNRYWKLSGNIQTLIGGRSQIQNQYCFYRLFYSNTSILDASALQLSADIYTTANYCYQSMFQGCSSLTQAPELPATALADSCYSSMFGNCSSLTQAPALPATTLASYCYQSMFYECTSLTQAPELPATALVWGCYQNMFQGCTSLTQAPDLPASTLVYGCYQNMFRGCTSLTQVLELPATTLASNCYNAMFQGCTSLTYAPELPATTLANCYFCYQNMFYGCSSLTQAPELPATTLYTSCYQSMFYGCTSLTQAPELPATTLVGSCYRNMFQNCTSLTQAPALPATTLVGSCYRNMFNGCTSLNYIEIGATSWDSSYTTDWVSGVSSSGTFIKPESLVIGTDTGQIPQNNASGIPTGWTVINF